MSQNGCGKDLTQPGRSRKTSGFGSIKTSVLVFVPISIEKQASYSGSIISIRIRHTPSQIEPAANVVSALLARLSRGSTRSSGPISAYSRTVSIFDFVRWKSAKIVPVSHRLMTPGVRGITWVCDCCHRNEIAKSPIVAVTRNSRWLF